MVVALDVVQTASGETLFIGGGFRGAGPVTSPGVVARVWDGLAWQQFAGGLSVRHDGYLVPPVTFLEVLEVGTEPQLYAGGQFWMAGGYRALARHDGVSWQPVAQFRGYGTGEGGEQPYVLDVCQWDDGTGPALYVAGEFEAVIYDDGTSSVLNSVARIVDDVVEPVGGGVAGPFARARVCQVFDDGFDEALYVGGSFISVDGRPAQSLARLGLLPGDANCDGAVDGFDIDAFVLALTSPDDYAAQYPSCPTRLIDLDRSGAIDGFDIDPFIALLTSE
jgi:hypothetical protein